MHISKQLHLNSINYVYFAKKPFVMVPNITIVSGRRLIEATMPATDQALSSLLDVSYVQSQGSLSRLVPCADRREGL